MPSSARKVPATYEDVLNAPEHLVAEIVDDELWTSPRPALRHAGASSSLLQIIGPLDRRDPNGSGQWLVLMEPELHIVGQILVPDLAGWRSERLPQLPDEAYVTIAPDWVCEVLSPSTMALDRTRKMRHYARAGVSHLWFIDPHPETLEVYRLDGDTNRAVAGAAGLTSVHAEPFEALALDLGRLWAR